MHAAAASSLWVASLGLTEIGIPDGTNDDDDDGTNDDDDGTNDDDDGTDDDDDDDTNDGDVINFLMSTVVWTRSCLPWVCRFRYPLCPVWKINDLDLLMTPLSASSSPELWDSSWWLPARRDIDARLAEKQRNSNPKSHTLVSCSSWSAAMGRSRFSFML